MVDGACEENNCARLNKASGTARRCRQFVMGMTHKIFTHQNYVRKRDQFSYFRDPLSCSSDSVVEKWISEISQPISADVTLRRVYSLSALLLRLDAAVCLHGHSCVNSIFNGHV